MRVKIGTTDKQKASLTIGTTWHHIICKFGTANYDCSIDGATTITNASTGWNSDVSPYPKIPLIARTCSFSGD
jgi:hypothetical protein